MLEWLENRQAEYEEAIFENIVLFASMTAPLKQIPVPKFLQSIVPQCESTLRDRKKAKVGGLVIMNITVNLPKDEIKKAKKSNTPADAEPASSAPAEIKPNIVLAPIKISPMDHIKFDLLESVFERLGNACSQTLIANYDVKAGEVVGLRLPLVYLGVPKDKMQNLAEKYLASSPLTMRVFV